MDSYIGEIRILPYSYAPDQWAWCNGQQVSINQNNALYAVIGLLYGGDGRTYFNLPNLFTAAGKAGACPVGTGAGTGLTPRSLGPNQFGEGNVQLTTANLPGHTHSFTAQNTNVNANIMGNPSGAWLSRGFVQSPAAGFFTYATKDPAHVVAFRAPSMSPVGSNSPSPHANMQPFQAMNFCISLAGEFPMRP